MTFQVCDLALPFYRVRRVGFVGELGRDELRERSALPDLLNDRRSCRHGAKRLFNIFRRRRSGQEARSEVELPMDKLSLTN